MCGWGWDRDYKDALTHTPYEQTEDDFASEQFESQYFVNGWQPTEVDR